MEDVEVDSPDWGDTGEWRKFKAEEEYEDVPVPENITFWAETVWP